MSESADVVVVGSGAGGAPVAYQLAQAGARVVVLERGPRLTRKDFVYDEIAVARREMFVPSADTDPHVVFHRDGEVKRTNEGWIALCVGGGTVHMSGFFYRFRPEDFRLKDHMGELPGAEIANWPITYDELEPWYAQVEKLIGVSGSDEEGPHVSKRSTPYPLPPVITHPAGALIDAAAQKLGARAFVTPRAVLSREYDGRGACHHHPLCGSFGCHNGAKSSTLETFLPKAEATGKCTIIANARAHRIEVNEDGSARGVVYRDAQGVDHEVKARAVVVACSAIESARLLLMSTSAKHPKGIGNAEGRVGRGLMFSTLSKAHASFAPGKDPKHWDSNAAFLGRSVADYYLATDKKTGVRKGGGLNFLFPAGGPIFQSELVAAGSEPVLFGKALKDALRHYWHEQRQVDCETFGEYLPTPGTLVTLDPAIKDDAGYAAARILVDRHPHDERVSKLLADRAAAILDGAGAQKVWTSDVNGITWHLPMGGCRMGADAKASVVDKNGRSHSVKNLFVSDGSVFPSSGGWPPTLTIMANALRIGAAIRDALAKKEL